jgi:hypothetical protein
MSLRLKLGLSSESLDEEGTPDEIAERKRKRVRDARVDAARSNANWIEVEEKFVRRPPNLLVQSDTGQTFRIYRGEVFAYGSATVAFVSERSTMWFYVREDGEVQFVEYLGQWETIHAKRIAR